MPNLSPTLPLPKFWLPTESTKSADYTVLGTDIGTMFLTGGGANRTFTLPTLALGAATGQFWCLFYNTQANNLIITAPANKLISLNNLTGTTATYSTANQIIGAAALVFLNDAGTFYHLITLNSSTATIT